MFWGFSSALDLYQEYINAFKIPDDPKADPEEQPAALNVLICGGADPRHVIKTLAKRYTHVGKPQLNIYLLDACVEIMARNMLLLGLALEPSDSFSLMCKTHLFMDIYGNSLMRPSSHHYVSAKARTLLNMICDSNVLQCICPMLNIDGLKYKERDGLEASFSFWQPRDHVFNIQSYWEQRVRKLLGPRYDHRQGAFDWDLSMTLKSREGQQICSQEYRYWRECGVAFVFPEYEHCKPNKTLAAGLVRNGRVFLNRGYVGDIQTGPFCGFGLRSSEERLHHSVHGENDYRATDVTERNLLEFFHELQTQTPYEHDKDISRRYGCTQLLMTPLLTFNECDIIEGQQRYDKPWITFPDVRLHFISPMEMMELQKGAPRWKDFFDIAFVAYNYYNFLSKEFFNALRERSLFVLETKVMTVERDEQVQKYEATAKDFLKSSGLRPCINYQAINAKFMQLKFKKTPGGIGDGEDEFPDEPIKDEQEEEEEFYDTLQIEEIKNDEMPNDAEQQIDNKQLKEHGTEEPNLKVEEYKDEPIKDKSSCLDAKLLNQYEDNSNNEKIQDIETQQQEHQDQQDVISEHDSEYLDALSQASFD